MTVITYIEIRVVVKNISIDDTIKIKNGTGNPVFNINGYTETAIGMNITAHIIKEICKLVIFRCFEKIPILTAATSELKEIAPSARPYKKLLAPIVIFTI
ncbi:hypothetical protein [Clostridioides difficile]|uniref:hypothetical protein n=4 Tax=Clostridioides difficile TaxID=1496 RepID=UPI00031D92D1|nr:hypothetical protein [Clostridioides difficile]